MIPPVPLIARLALSAACVLVSRGALALARWIAPELYRRRPAAGERGGQR